LEIPLSIMALTAAMAQVAICVATCAAICVPLILALLPNGVCDDCSDWNSAL
jgi:hypothetical protein